MIPSYASRYKAIRQYVNFKVSKNPTPAQKRMIAKYYDAAVQYELIGRDVSPSVFIYRTRSPKLLKIAKEAANQEPGFPAFKVAIFRDVPKGVAIRARKDDGEWHMKRESEYRRERIFLFKDYEKTPGEFALNPQAVMKRILRKCKTAHAIRFITGEWLSKSTRNADTAMAGLMKFINNYGSENRPKEGDQFQSWLRGVLAIWFTNQKDRTEYLRNMQDREERRKQRNKALKHRWKEDV
jgi:hypothetical protein